MPISLHLLVQLIETLRHFPSISDPLIYDGKDFPPVAEAFGWVLELGPLTWAVLVPCKEIWKCFHEGKTLRETAKIMITPSQKWSIKTRDGANLENVGHAETVSVVFNPKTNLGFQPDGDQSHHID